MGADTTSELRQLQHRPHDHRRNDSVDMENTRVEPRENGSLLSIDKPPPRCGCFGWRPDWLQKFYNRYMGLFLLCWVSCLQSLMISGLNNVNVQLYERRFRIDSSVSGSISSCYDIASGLSVLLVSYYGNTGRKPLWLAMSSLLYVISAFVMFLPHMLAPSYEAVDDLCAVTDCSIADESASIKYYVIIIMLGIGIGGVGGSILYSLGTSFIDDCVNQKSSPLFISIFYGAAALGPAIGFIAGGSLTNIWVNWHEHSDLTPTDPRWVGAWWLGFLFVFLLLIPSTILLFMFDYELPEARLVRQQRKSEAHVNTTGEIQDTDLLQRASFGHTLKDLPMATKIVVKNPAFMAVTITGSMEGAILAGFTTFLAKYVSNQFGMEYAYAAILSGIVIVPAAVIAQFLSGLFCKRFSLKVRGLLTLMLIGHLSTIAILPSLLIYCDSPDIIGVNMDYSNKMTLTTQDLSNTCNTGRAVCNCTTTTYAPLCIDDQYQYFSPCYAGCGDAKISHANPTELVKCQCPTELMGGSATNQTAARFGPCTQDCQKIYVFLFFFFLIVFGMFFIQVPISSVTLRVVSSKQRTFAIGVQWTFIRFLGLLPGPLLFGALLDYSCVVWQEECGSKGTCWVYDSKTAALSVMVLVSTLKVVSMLSTLTGLCLYQPPLGSDPSDALTRRLSCLFCLKSENVLIKQRDTGDEEDDLFENAPDAPLQAATPVRSLSLIRESGYQQLPEDEVAFHHS